MQGKMPLISENFKSQNVPEYHILSQKLKPIGEQAE